MSGLLGVEQGERRCLRGLVIRWWGLETGWNAGVAGERRGSVWVQVGGVGVLAK